MKLPLLDRWARASQQSARRNAMVATTELTQRRIERDEVEAYLATRALRRTAQRPEPEGAVDATR
ncbi:MAG: hypothetical protein WKF50_04455 [Nocardioides sp.]